MPDVISSKVPPSEPDKSEIEDNEFYDAMCDIDAVEEEPVEKPVVEDQVRPPQSEGAQRVITDESLADKMRRNPDNDFSAYTDSRELAEVEEVWDNISILMSRLYNSVEAFAQKEGKSHNAPKVEKLQVILRSAIAECGLFQDALEEMIE